MMICDTMDHQNNVEDQEPGSGISIFRYERLHNMTTAASAALSCHDIILCQIAICNPVEKCEKNIFILDFNRVCTYIYIYIYTYTYIQTN